MFLYVIFHALNGEDGDELVSAPFALVKGVARLVTRIERREQLLMRVVGSHAQGRSAALHRRRAKAIAAAASVVHRQMTTVVIDLAGLRVPAV